MRILITGANGFVGKHAVAKLQKKHDVFCLVRDRRYRNKDSTVIYFDSHDDAQVEYAVKSCEAVVHIASRIHGTKKQMYSANVGFTKRLVSLAKKHGTNHFVYISSENVLQDLDDLYTETKGLAEKEVKKLKSYTILRPTVIYGQGDKKYVTRLIRIMKTFPVVPIIGNGKNKFQFVYIDDLIAIINKSLEHKIYGTYVVAGPDSISYSDFIKLLMQELKIKKPVVKVPIGVAKPVAHILNALFPTPPLTPTQIKNLEKNRVYDISKVVNIFKYKPTKLIAGIQKLIAGEF